MVLPRPARGAGTLIPSAQRLVWAAKQALGPSVFPSGEPGVSGDFWGSQEGCQGAGSLKKQESSRKTSTSALLITPKPLTVCKPPIGLGEPSHVPPRSEASPRPSGTRGISV